jgi:hypothetical protein
MYVIQGPRDVVRVLTSYNDVRHIHLTDKHSPNAKTSWRGESIGHYEDDVLVVDTIGVDERTPVGAFGTPHTKELHMIERYHLIEDGNALEVKVHVEDPGAFTVPWDASQRFRQYEETMRNIPVERIVELGAPAEGPPGGGDLRRESECLLSRHGLTSSAANCGTRFLAASLAFDVPAPAGAIDLTGLVAALFWRRGFEHRGR